MCFSLARCHCAQRWNTYLQVKKIHAYIFKYCVYVLLCPIFQMLLTLSSIKLIFILLLWVPSYTAKQELTAIQTALISHTQGEICLLDTCWKCSPSMWSSSFKSEFNTRMYIKHLMLHYYNFLNYLSVPLFFSLLLFCHLWRCTGLHSVIFLSK